MNSKKCDFCKKLYDGGGSTISGKILWQFRHREKCVLPFHESTEDEYDLCPICDKVLTAVIESLFSARQGK